jgi:hypothetical protein
VGLQKHAPFLSCCKLWYGTNRICYDFVLRETWHPEISFSKMLKSKVPQWLWIPTKAIWHDIQIQNLSHATCLSIELCQIVVTRVEILIMHPWSRHTYTHKKTANSYTESYAQHAFSVHQNNTPFTLSWYLSLIVSYAKKKVMGYVKKREKNPCQGT